ncbi:MAG: translesion error-prone DNA polymerase V autoproteolytic subunit [Humidesulfovibrio sp.]|uniref:LexA family protein n=1 Tax=Humidesulfovibrio sp. TaxID=2910988 RepID=UPI0027F22E53|nr:translesion error-prone DNA polymerase V autoproteolytic subunit [Humidesulfovibrio sp.]MDQ7834409.1 translesion error-prone DNA polymerase V autoproteolytic subunit [Humidesulfovibrio sp.]
MNIRTNGLEILGPVDPEQRPKLRLPLFLAGVQAGFPSPADDFIDKRLDLNEHLIQHPAATFFVRAVGDSMLGAGIHDGDLLIVDRAVEAQAGKIVIAAVNGELTVKRLERRGQRMLLVPANADFLPIDITDALDSGEGFEVWGVVTSVIHKL